LYCGANAVASGDRAKEYLGDYASYCKPDNIKSIKDAIKREFYAKRPTLNSSIKREFTWENAAKQTLKIYSELVSEDK